jgi:membrane fusion protein (multidrug efflux system)
MSRRVLPSALRVRPLLLAAGLVATSLTGCKPQGDAQPEPAKTDAAGSAKPRAALAPAKATRIEVAVLGASNAGGDLRLPGEVEGSRDALLASSMGGFIEQVKVKVGDRVRAGQPLIAVDSASHTARLGVAKVELTAAERELRRAKELGNALPKAQLDAAETRLAAAKANLASLQVAVARSIVAASFDGTVVQVDAEVGEVAAPGAPLVRVVQLDPIRVTVSLSDRDVLVVKAGQKVQVTTEGRPDPFDGEVKRVRQAADLRTRTFIAEIDVPKGEGALLPGMIAQVAIPIAAGDDRLAISQDWLVTRLDGVGAFVDDGGVARYRPLKLGPVLGRSVVIEEGLRAGDRLVVTGHRELADGDPLIVSREGRCCSAGRVEWASAVASTKGGAEAAAPTATPTPAPGEGAGK